MDIKTFDLTLEQKFELQKMQAAAHQMSREQLVDLLLKSARLIMLKDNAIKDLISQLHNTTGLPRL
jgi:hypothetical protein